MTAGRSPEQEAEARRKEDVVMKARIRGHSFARIEREHGIINAARVFRRAIERGENVGFRRAEAIRLEEERMDALQEGLWDRAVGGDPRAVEVCLKVLERRARIGGLDFADQISGQMVEVEQAKVRVMATALVAALGAVDGLTADQRAAVQREFFSSLRALEAAPGGTPALSPEDEALL